jgi:hypothetical protein
VIEFFLSLSLISFLFMQLVYFLFLQSLFIIVSLLEGIKMKIGRERRRNGDCAAKYKSTFL